MAQYFIETKENTGTGLASDIVDKLQVDGLNINNCRGQSFDNGANMTGKIKGVQANITKLNELAVFVPCTAHSLNLVGVHAAETSPAMITFFGSVQKIFVFFFSSTSRWNMLKNVINITLKKHSDIRWSSKKQAISALHTNIISITMILKQMRDTTNMNYDTIDGCNQILRLIDLKFLCLLNI